ncbi:MAG: hypothetical protein CMH56_15530 [Myxococcales bacterium]|nr:hypothetical protein [Myxococcales bacterium]
MVADIICLLISEWALIPSDGVSSLNQNPVKPTYYAPRFPWVFAKIGCQTAFFALKHSLKPLWASDAHPTTAIPPWLY